MARGGGDHRDPAVPWREAAAARAGRPLRRRDVPGVERAGAAGGRPVLLLVWERARPDRGGAVQGGGAGGGAGPYWKPSRGLVTSSSLSPTGRGSSTAPVFACR